MERERKKGILYAVLIAIITAISGLLIGYNTAIIAGALEFIAKTYHLSTLLKELLVSSILIGGLLGAMGGGPIANTFGRKPLLLLTSIIYIVCTVLLSRVHGITSMIFWRFCLGLAVGASSMVAPLFIAETAPAKWRGALVVGVQLAITLGILLSYCVSYLLLDSGNWRLMFLLASVPAAVFFVGLLLLPESPRWLVLAGQKEKAKTILNRLGEDNLAAEIAQMEAATSEKGHLGASGNSSFESKSRRVAFEQRSVHEAYMSSGKSDTTQNLDKNWISGGAHWRTLLSARVRPVLILSAGLFLFQNMSGIDGILYYAPAIFNRIGLLGAHSSLLATVILGGINFLATIIALSLVDKIGRRPLLLFGLAVMTASFVTLTLVLNYASNVEVLHWLSVGCLSLYVATFAISLGPIPYVMMSEVFPLRVRSHGMSIASATAWGINILVSMTFLTLAQTLGQSGLFLLYAGVCFLGLIFCFTMVPETKGCTLEDIEGNLNAGLPTRQLGR